MLSSDHGKMPVPLCGKIAAALVKDLAENALKPLLLFAAHPRAELILSAEHSEVLASLRSQRKFQSLFRRFDF